MAEQIVNAGFEDGTLDPAHVNDNGGLWSAVQANPRSGLWAAQYDPSGQTGVGVLTMNGTPVTFASHPVSPEGTTIRLTAWTRAATDDVSNGIRFQVQFRDNVNALVENITSTAVNPDSTYQTITVDATAPATSAYAAFRVLINKDGNPNLIFVDDVHAVVVPPSPGAGLRRRHVRVITDADTGIFPLPKRKHVEVIADPKYQRNHLISDDDAPIQRWVQVVENPDPPLSVRKQVSIEGL